MLNKKFVSTYLIPFLFFALLSLIIIFSWFRYGYMYGGGDVGLPSYDPKRILEISKYLWWEASAPGSLIPNSTISAPLAFVLSILQTLGFSDVAIQATLFYTLLVVMGYGMYLVGLSVFGREKQSLAYLAALFYMFNPYMMIQVWHRFVHTTFFLAAALPFIFLFFRAWINEGKYWSLFLFLLTNFLAAYLYGTWAYVATIFVILFLITLYEILFPRCSFKSLQVILFRFGLGVITWFFIHAWWMLPSFNVAPALYSTQHSTADNLVTFLSISEQARVPYSLIGVNPFYLFEQKDWGEIYDLPFFRFIPWLSIIFIIPGFIKSLLNKRFVFWPLLSLAGLFLAKGGADPFGYPYIFGFSNFFPLGALRNPFEKMGILIPFSYSILFSVGIYWYLENSKKKSKLLVKFLIAVVLILILGVHAWPMWFGKMFGTLDKPAFVKVPDSYKKADEYIKNKNLSGKILHLPLTVNESIAYKWKYGYSGVEPSQLLFKSLPSISHTFNLGIPDEALVALSHIFFLQDSDDKIQTLLQSFATKFILLHKDVHWLGGQMMNPEDLELRLDKLNFLKKESQFGDLVIYELKDEIFNPKIKIADTFSYVTYPENKGYWSWLLSTGGIDLLSPASSNSDTLIPNSVEVIATPEKVYNFSPQTVAKENILGEMPAAKILPDSPLYPVVRLKEKIQYFTIPVFDQFSFKITLAGKRLIEIYYLKAKDSKKPITPLLQEYLHELEYLKEGTKVRSNRSESKGEISINFILSRHLGTLNLIREKSNSNEKEIIDDAAEQLVTFMKETNVLPFHEIMEEDSLSQGSVVSRFNVPVSGRYELLQAHQDSLEIYPNRLSSGKFQINNKVLELKGTLTDQFISYGTVDLASGLNEIIFNSISSVNLVTFSKQTSRGVVEINNNEVNITSGKHDPSYIEIDIEPILRGNSYQLVFDSWIKRGDKFRVQVLQDTDTYDLLKIDEKLPFYDNDFIRNQYNSYWIENVFNFYINPATTRASVRLVVNPWDGCKHSQSIKELCSEKLINAQYEKESEVVFKNIKIVRNLNNPVFLKATLPPKQIASQKGNIIFEQKSPTLYTGEIKLKSPGFFIFNESYNLGWELSIIGDKEGISSKRFLSNLYGNSWYIEKEGNHKFILEFIPQKLVKKGIIISLITIIIMVILVTRERLKHEK